MIQNLCAAFSVAFLSSVAIAQDAAVSVLHGIPGLPQPVEVFANGTRLFAFDFGDLEGPLSVPAGVTNLEVRLNGNTVLQASPDLQADTNYTVVAHLLEGGGNQLTAFVNDLSRVEGTGEFFATVVFRHVADAPAVDVYGDRFGQEFRVYTDVSNGEEGADRSSNAAWLLSGAYDIRLTPTGSNQTAFGPDPVGRFSSGDFYSVFAIGELGQNSFRLVTQTIETPRFLPGLQATVQGTACGGQISLSTNNVQFDQDFDVVFSGGPQNGTAILLTGVSDSRLFGALPLPLDLAPLGAAGCILYQDSVGAISVNLDANGDARVTESIPAQLSGFVERNGLYFQYAFLNPGANSLGVQLTEYVAIEAN